MKVSQLLEEVKGASLTGGDAQICGLCADSRVVGKGDLFFCLSGTQVDAHAYALQAQARGAAAVVCERKTEATCPQAIVPDVREAMARIAAVFYGHPERKMRIVGVTGTNGKTTTAFMVKNILDAAGIRAGLTGTLGARYANITVASELTTPDPVFLFSLLADMAKAGVEAAVMEVSAHALFFRKERPICYDVGIFTNLTRDHLDFFGDMRQYAAAKRRLFVPERCRFAVLNADDAFGRTLLKSGVPAKTYGLESPADAFAIVESETLRGCRAVLNLEDELCEATLSMTGRHNLLNALAAACAARHLGADMDAVARGLAATQVEGRLEWVARKNGADIFVDFAHTPDGLEKSLTALREFCLGRLFVLFGCGGNRDAGKRASMGAIAARYADHAILTSDNPRYEDPAAILSEIERGFRTVSDSYVVVEERDRAIGYAVGCLSEGDILLVAGKGAERYQEIMGIKYEYNDKAVIGSIPEK